MLIRFLIVALAILNVGVALWWMVPRAAPPVTPEAAETGVASLELVPMDAVETPSQASPAPSPAPAEAPPPAAVPARAPAEADKTVAATTAPPAARPERCFSFGPFDSRERAQAAAATLGADLARSHLREVPSKAATSYRVLIPPAASREDAQAMVKRIVDAGFGDYFIIAQGEDANAIALGQYRNREGAERRLSALTAAGFPARIASNGTETDASWWLDVAHAGSASTADLQRRSGAAQQQSLDCGRLR